MVSIQELLLSFDEEEIPSSSNGFEQQNDENEFVEKIVDDIVYVVAEENVGENLLSIDFIFK